MLVLGSLSPFYWVQATGLGNGTAHTQGSSSHLKVSSQTSPEMCFHDF